MKKQLINWPQGTPPSPGAPRRQRHAVSLPTELVAQHAVPRVSRQMGVQQRGSDAVLADLQRTNTQVTERAVYPGRTIRTFRLDRKSTRLNSSHVAISYAVF